MSLSDVEREHRRLAILRHLERSAEYTSNAAILVDVVNGVGVRSTRAQVEGEIAWLEEQGLASATRHDDFIVVTATSAGADVAAGRSTYPGVRRPSARG